LGHWDKIEIGTAKSWLGLIGPSEKTGIRLSPQSEGSSDKHSFGREVYDALGRDWQVFSKRCPSLGLLQTVPFAFTVFKLRQAVSIGATQKHPFKSASAAEAGGG